MIKPQPTISEGNLEIFLTNQKWKILQTLHRKRETVKIINLVNLTANTKNYGQITLYTKPHSDPLLRQFRLFQKISEDCWGFAKTTEDFQEQPTISAGKSRIFLNEKKQNKTKQNKQPSKQLTVFFSATVNITKLDNLTANSKN